MASFWCLYCELWTDFTYCSDVFIADIEQINAGWAYIESAGILLKYLGLNEADGNNTEEENEEAESILMSQSINIHEELLQQVKSPNQPSSGGFSREIYNQPGPSGYKREISSETGPVGYDTEYVFSFSFVNEILNLPGILCCLNNVDLN